LADEQTHFALFLDMSSISELTGYEDFYRKAGNLFNYIGGYHGRMVGGSAAGDQQVFAVFQKVFYLGGKRQYAILASRMQRVTQSLGLLADLLEHEVFESALLCCFHIPFDGLDFPLDLIPIEVVDMHLILRKSGNLQILQVLDFPGMAQKRRHIAGQHGGMLASSDDQGTVLSCNHQHLGVLTAGNCNGIGAFQALDRLRDGQQEIAVVVEVDQVGDDLAVGLARELHLMLLKP